MGHIKINDKGELWVNLTHLLKFIRVEVCGDLWTNSTQVKEQLASVCSSDWICFDTGAEGISLGHSGILDFINQWAKSTGHFFERITINSPNVYEKTQYQNIYQGHTHFLALSKHYYTEVPVIDSNATKFGFFVGRHTTQRDRMALDIINNYRSHFVMSVMKTTYGSSPWSEPIQSIASIDHMSIGDQYQGSVDTNLSLLQFYNQFQIEIVAETMCAGTTFFPTEKTFRPMTGQRPFLVFGPVHFLNNLRELGFRTYNECWDESYDCYSGIERWQRMQYVINDIIHHGYDLNLAIQIADHNRAHLTLWHEFATSTDMPRINDN
jgi:hypothetical protein